MLCCVCVCCVCARACKTGCARGRVVITMRRGRQGCGGLATPPTLSQAHTLPNTRTHKHTRTHTHTHHTTPPHTHYAQTVPRAAQAAPQRLVARVARQARGPDVLLRPPAAHARALPAGVGCWVCVGVWGVCGWAFSLKECRVSQQSRAPSHPLNYPQHRKHPPPPKQRKPQNQTRSCSRPRTGQS